MRPPPEQVEKPAPRLSSGEGFDLMAEAVQFLENGSGSLVITADSIATVSRDECRVAMKCLTAWTPRGKERKRTITREAALRSTA